MAKKPTTKRPKPVHVFALGDEVEILRFGSGKIVELRGALGPDGAEVYRVMFRKWPRPGYIEVLGEQIRPLNATTPDKVTKRKSTPETPNSTYPSTRS